LYVTLETIKHEDGKSYLHGDAIGFIQPEDSTHPNIKTWIPKVYKWAHELDNVVFLSDMKASK
jgi:hypothetical protein